MKNNLLIVIFFLIISLCFAQLDEIKDVYTVKPGDVFVVQIFDIETEQMKLPVTINGNIILYPLTAPLQVAGLSVGEAIIAIQNELKKLFVNAEIIVEFFDFSTHRINIIGAVSNPGEYIIDTLATLSQSLKIAGGLIPAASKKVDIIRRGKRTTYDLRDFLLNGNQKQNPLIFGEDLIVASMAKDFAKIQVVTDSVNFVEYIEPDDKTSVIQYLKTLRAKHHNSDYRNLFLSSEGKFKAINGDYIPKIGDNIYLQPEENYIFVRGNVNSPGKFNYFAGKSPHYYVSLAGGVSRVGSAKAISIISKDGVRSRYRGQSLNEGDTVIVPLSTRTYVMDYLAPISTVLSLITTIVVLSR